MPPSAFENLDDNGGLAGLADSTLSPVTPNNDETIENGAGTSSTSQLQRLMPEEQANAALSLPSVQTLAVVEAGLPTASETAQDVSLDSASTLLTTAVVSEDLGRGMLAVESNARLVSLGGASADGFGEAVQLRSTAETMVAHPETLPNTDRLSPDPPLDSQADGAPQLSDALPATVGRTLLAAMAEEAAADVVSIAVEAHVVPAERELLAMPGEKLEDLQSAVGAPSLDNATGPPEGSLRKADDDALTVASVPVPAEMRDSPETADAATLTIAAAAAPIEDASHTFHDASVDDGSVDPSAALLTATLDAPGNVADIAAIQQTISAAVPPDAAPTAGLQSSWLDSTPEAELEFSLSPAVASAEPLNVDGDGIVRDEIWENQRWFAGLGFSKRFLRPYERSGYSTEDGVTRPCISDVSRAVALLLLIAARHSIVKLCFHRVGDFLFSPGRATSWLGVARPALDH